VRDVDWFGYPHWIHVPDEGTTTHFFWKDESNMRFDTRDEEEAGMAGGIAYMPDGQETDFDGLCSVFNYAYDTVCFDTSI